MVKRLFFCKAHHEDAVNAAKAETKQLNNWHIQDAIDRHAAQRRGDN